MTIWAITFMDLKSWWHWWLTCGHKEMDLGRTVGNLFLFFVSVLYNLFLWVFLWLFMSNLRETKGKKNSFEKFPFAHITRIFKKFFISSIFFIFSPPIIHFPSPTIIFGPFFICFSLNCYNFFFVFHRKNVTKHGLS